jgi:hypothetical protein
MRKQAALILVVFILIFVRKTCLGNSLIIPDPAGINIDSRSDSIPKRIPFATIKINPTQFLFNEIPLSLEVFIPNKKSIQLQIGYIFPFDNDYYNNLEPDNPLQWLLSFKEAIGSLGEAIYSSHVRPYNSKGFSLKLEFRKYKRFIYFAPQLMYKYSFAKEYSYHFERKHDPSFDQTESNNANVFGVGCIVGRQFYAGPVVFDAYYGIGIRYRYMSVTVLKIQYEYGPATKYPNETSSMNSVYPFLNVGMRVGIKFK